MALYDKIYELLESFNDARESFRNSPKDFFANLFKKKSGTSRKMTVKRKSDSKPSKSKIIRSVLYGLAGLILLVVVVAAIYVGSILGKIDFVSDEEMAITEDLTTIVLEDEEIVDEEDTMNEEEMAAVDEAVTNSVVTEDGLMHQDGVTNILVLGTDGRKASTTRARSDVMIIMSINENTKQIVLTSVMRDVYVAIPGRGGNDKINAAHAYGGPALAIQTVEQAFGVRIDHFVSVNFYAFMDIVDAMGGVDIHNISGAERDSINVYIAEINKYLGLDRSHGALNATGDVVHLTGKQAMGYVRVRNVGHGDYERTARQREVLEQLIQKARQTDYLTLMGIVDTVAENLSTDYSALELMDLAMQAGDYLGYEIVQQRIPAEGTYQGGIFYGKWILKIDFEANRKMLHESIFTFE